MVAAAHAEAVAPSPEPGEARFLMHGVAWSEYVLLRDALEIPGLRMTFYKGTLELTSPSRQHELVKKNIARLLEVYALERDVPLYGYGSTTFRREAKERGLEPDECYCVGGEMKETPDIALEVVLTSGGLAKLPVYEGLNVREVWFWEKRAFHLYRLGDAGYEPIASSQLIAGLDLASLARFVERTDQPNAVREYRDELRAHT